MTDTILSILLLDCRIISIPYQNYSPNELLRFVSSLLSLDYDFTVKHFGFSYRDFCERMCWLNQSRSLYEHDVQRSEENIKRLTFRLKFLSPSWNYKEGTIFYFQYFLDTRRNFFLGEILCSLDELYQLLALNLLVENGHYLNEEALVASITHPGRVPHWALNYISYAQCIYGVIRRCEDLNKCSRGEAVLKFIEICEQLPTFGVQYHDVMDKSETMWVGLSSRGLGLYSLMDKANPLKMCSWSSVLNIYSRNNRVSVEITDRSSMTSSSEVKVLAWHVSSEQKAKILREEAAAFFAFYRNSSITNVSTTPGGGRSSHARVRLCNALDNLVESDNVNNLCISFQVDFHQSPLHNIFSVTYVPVDVLNNRNDEFMLEMFGTQGDLDLDRDLKVKELHDRLYKLSRLLAAKKEEFRQLCLDEAAITGTLPYDYESTTDQHSNNLSRRYMKTEYSIDPMFQLYRDSHSQNSSSSYITGVDRVDGVDEIEDLELQYEIQSKILLAKEKLLRNSSGLNKSEMKLKHAEVKNLSQKLHAIEQKLFYLRSRRPTLRPAKSSISLSILTDNDSAPDNRSSRQNSMNSRTTPASFRSQQPRSLSQSRSNTSLSSIQSSGPWRVVPPSAPPRPLRSLKSSSVSSSSGFRDIIISSSPPPPPTAAAAPVAPVIVYPHMNKTNVENNLIVTNDRDWENCLLAVEQLKLKKRSSRRVPSLRSQIFKATMESTENGEEENEENFNVETGGGGGLRTANSCSEFLMTTPPSSSRSTFSGVFPRHHHRHHYSNNSLNLSRDSPPQAIYSNLQPADNNNHSSGFRLSPSLNDDDSPQRLPPRLFTTGKTSLV